MSVAQPLIPQVKAAIKPAQLFNFIFGEASKLGKMNGRAKTLKKSSHRDTLCSNAFITELEAFKFYAECAFCKSALKAITGSFFCMQRTYRDKPAHKRV